MQFVTKEKFFDVLPQITVLLQRASCILEAPVNLSGHLIIITIMVSLVYDYLPKTTMLSLGIKTFNESAG